MKDTILRMLSEIKSFLFKVLHRVSSTSAWQGPQGEVVFLNVFIWNLSLIPVVGVFAARKAWGSPGDALLLVSGWLWFPAKSKRRKVIRFPYWASSRENSLFGMPRGVS